MLREFLFHILAHQKYVSLVAFYLTVHRLPCYLNVMFVTHPGPRLVLVASTDLPMSSRQWYPPNDLLDCRFTHCMPALHVSFHGSAITSHSAPKGSSAGWIPLMYRSSTIHKPMPPSILTTFARRNMPVRQATILHMHITTSVETCCNNSTQRKDLDVSHAPSLAHQSVALHLPNPESCVNGGGLKGSLAGRLSGGGDRPSKP